LKIFLFRSRHGSVESQPFAFETPQSSNVESKRRKISPTDVTHVSQTPESELKTPGVPKGPSPTQKQQRTSPTDRQSGETVSTSKTDITHISQSENYQLEDHSESPVIGQKRKATSPKNDITHISQSQESQREEKPKGSSISSPGGTKLRLTRSNADVTHISQSQESQHEEKPKGSSMSSPGGKKLRLTRSNADVTHISQSQESQREEKPKGSSMSSPGGKKLRLTRSNANVTHVSQSQLSQKEEHSPREKPNEKNPRETTHTPRSQKSQVKQSGTALNNNQRPKRNASEEEDTVIPESQTSPIQVKVKETPSPEISFTSKRRKICSPDLTHVSDTERSVNVEPQRSSSVSSPRTGQVNLDDSTSTCVENIASTGFSDHRTSVQNLSSIKSSVSPPGSGWMSKKSFSMKKEKSEMNQSENRTNIDGAVEDLGEPSSGRGFQESQGFSSNQEQQKVGSLPILTSFRFDAHYRYH
jgi:hypothetical protein